MFEHIENNIYKVFTFCRGTVSSLGIIAAARK